ncbi:MAG: LysR family transcriptional regulator [Sandaracinaceae bacterium]
MRVLLSLSRHGTAAAAGRALGMATSTVYRRVSALEAEVGAPCVIKGALPLTLTETGRALVGAAEDFHRGLASVSAEVARASEAVEGRVSVTTVPGFQPYLVAPLTVLAQQHPALLVDVHLGDDGPSVRRREVDLAVSVVPNPPEGLIGRRLSPVRYGVFGTPEACARTPRRWVVLGSQRTAGPEADWERQHASEQAVATGSRALMQALVEQGVGVALLPLRLGRRHPTWVELTEYADRTASLARDVWLLVHPEERDRAAVRVVFDTLLRTLESE